MLNTGSVSSQAGETGEATTSQEEDWKRRAGARMEEEERRWRRKEGGGGMGESRSGFVAHRVRRDFFAVLGITLRVLHSILTYNFCPGQEDTWGA